MAARPSIALIQPERIQEWERGEPVRIVSLLQSDSTRNGFDLASDPRDADLVVLLESCSFKTQHDLTGYESLPFTRDPWKLCCINYEDAPPGFLPGLYSSLESFRFDPSLHLSWPHMRLPNEMAESVSTPGEPDPDALLFSFSGARSHPLRNRLFDSIRPDKRWRVREVRKWYNHDGADKRAYVEEILASHFVLCPRGIASYSHRIVETLALGRVPVVIADDWVPFSIPERAYYVRVRENDVERLPQLLESALTRYAETREEVCRVYRSYFAPSVRYSVALNRLTRFFLDRRQAFGYETFSRRWRSRKFWHSNGWTLPQRVGRRLQRWRQHANARLTS